MTSYFDYNATNIPDDRLLQRFVKTLQTIHGNPSSPHHAGRKARSVIEAARQEIANAFQFDLSGVTFCATGSEALNLGISGLRQWTRGDEIICSEAEHKATIETVKHLEKHNHVKVHWIGLDSHGQLDISQIKRVMNNRVRLVIAMAANNETGVITPPAMVRAVIGCSLESPALLCDAVQSAVRTELDYGPADIITLSAHKMGCPRGAAAVLTREHITLNPILFGGGQERGRRPGTEQVAAIAALGYAAQLWSERSLLNLDSLKEMQTSLETRLRNELKGVKITAQKSARLPQTTHVQFAEMDAESTIAGLDLMGVQVSSGSACSSGSLLASHVLLAMGLSEEQARRSIRISYGPATSADDIDALIGALKTLAN